MDAWLESLVPWGTEALVRIQAYSPEWLIVFFRGITFLGNEEFFLFMLPLVYWCFNRRVGAGLGYLLMASTWANSVLKYTFAIGRPDDPRLRFFFSEPSPSFPSNHSQSAVVTWGYLASHVRRTWFWVVALLLALLIGVSRMVMAVHFPQDVLGGWLIGLVFLVVYTLAEPHVIRWLGARSRAVQLTLAVVLPVALIFIHPVDTDGLYPSSHAITPAAAVLGMGVGIVLERAYVRFDAGGPWLRRVLRFLLGMVLVGAVYVVPKLLLPAGVPHAVEATVRFVRYALVGWTTGFFCPWLFVTLGLASREADLPAAPAHLGLSV